MVRPQVDVYIEDGKIKQVGNHLIIPGGTRAIDATGKLVLPGGIDADVHFQTPHAVADGDDTVTVDDFYQGTKAALIGGTTFVIDTAVPAEGESLAEAVAKWKKWADGKVCCDYGLKVAVAGGAVDEKQFEQLAADEEAGVNTIEVQMAGGARLSDSELIEALDLCRKFGGLAHVRAESGELVAREERSLLQKGVTGPEGFALAHSEMAEEEATMRVTTLANQVGCPLFLGPVMSSSAADIVRRKKARGGVLFAETTPAALACEGDEYWHQCWSHAAGFVCAPPVRKGQKEQLVEAVSGDAGLDVVASNHRTFNKKQKALGKSDFTQIPAGVNGAECRMSVLWERAVHSGKMDPTRFVALTSAIPAKLFNCYPSRGRIEVGSEGDVVVWNPSATRTLSAKDHPLKVDFNVFEGMEVHGVPEVVICQGKIMVEDGLIRVMTGFGKFVPLEPHAPFVYDKVRAKEEADAMPRRGVVRTEEDMATNGDGEDLPRPSPPPSNVAEPAQSQQQSNFDLRSHPNGPDESASAARAGSARASVRVRAPPGGKSSGGFW